MKETEWKSVDLLSLEPVGIRRNEENENGCREGMDTFCYGTVA